jgi:hypothetical protein
MNLRLFSLLGCFLASSVIAQDTPLPAKEQFHLFLLVGQSNMAGRGVVEEQDQTPHPHSVRCRRLAHRHLAAGRVLSGDEKPSMG